jgi:hypothetical protein
MEYQKLPASMRQTLGKMVNVRLINPSKFGGDGRAVNTVHCFKAILNEYGDCINPNCEGRMRLLEETYLIPS